MKLKRGRVWVGIVFFSLLLVSMQITEASPGVIVDQYDYQEDCITIAYPHFDGMVNQEAQDNMNAMMENLVETYIADARRSVEEASQYSTHSFRPVAQLNYKVWHNDEDLLSITLSLYQYLGGAHGMSALTGYTFNLETGAVIPYTERFSWDAASREKAYDTIMKQVEERKIYLFKKNNQSDLEVKFKNPSYIPNYYLVAKDKPIIIFQQYEIAPYAAGILQFNVK